MEKINPQTDKNGRTTYNLKNQIKEKLLKEQEVKQQKDNEEYKLMMSSIGIETRVGIGGENE